MTDTYAVTVDLSAEKMQGSLMYCLLTDTIVIENECIPVYGVSIAFAQGGNIQFDKVHNITSSIEKMLELIELMKEGLVFPANLRDIVEDFIA